ncbi:MAG TPA: hypothetical protein ENK04_06895 [Gammaproteobacteria bacterium]|nr:hypothetical protein [Gammaproteobacteria bacterium]
MKFILVLVVSLMPNAVVANSEITDVLKNNILNNLKYIQEEDADRSMSTMHSQSPAYLPTKNMLPQIFGSYKLSYELLSFKFIAYDGDLAYARVKQSTKKISGPAFRNNEIDMVQLFRKESGVWKLWAQVNIDIEYIN